jgi:hypothetical protein
LITTASLTLLALLASVVLTLTELGSPVAVAHLTFAVGIVPLIFAAISHFVPVLTRTGDPEKRIRWLPGLLQISGLFVVAALQGWLPRWVLHPIVTVDVIFGLIFLHWILGRAKRCLGSPHPGWRWYVAALSCLLLALFVVPLLTAVPAWYGSLRAIHLHLNTLGLVGLAALGTLPVLLPTVLGQGDPDAAGWLRRRLWPALAGVFAVSLGAGLFWWLAVPGAAILFVVSFGLLGQWIRRYGVSRLLSDGAAASLLAALLGLLFNLMAGVAHAANLLAARPAIAAWALGFLLPLVTGALTQLLPVWRWPGPVIPARALMRQKLAVSGVWRAAFFLLGGLALLAGFTEVGGVFAGLAIGLFAFGLLQAMRVSRSTR